MNLLDLEEAQGLTPEKMRAYLEGKGWVLTKLGGKQCYWNTPSGKQSHVMGDGWEWWLDALLGMVASEEGRSVEAVLREMNPRFRQGIPSEAARGAHPGLWIAKTMSSGLLVGRWQQHASFGLMLDCFGMTLQAKAEWSYWPADDNAERVSWPEKGGALL